MVTRMKPFNGAMFLLMALLACTGWDLYAGPAASFQFEVGAGKGCFGISTSEEGPESGPVAIIPAENGLVVFDSVNSKLVRLDDQGRWISEFLLDKGTYKDAARTRDGRLWMAEEKSRTIFRATAGGVEKAFAIPDGPNLPAQFDLLAGTQDELVIADFSSHQLHWFALDGALRNVASMPVCLTIVTDPQGMVAGLCPSCDQDGTYSTLFRLSKDGTRVDTKLTGGALQGARLIGFLADGRAIALGVAGQEPFRRELFLIDQEGKTTLLDTIETQLLSATRFGFVEKSALWLNVSPIGGNRIVLFRYEIADAAKKQEKAR